MKQLLLATAAALLFTLPISAQSTVRQDASFSPTATVLQEKQQDAKKKSTKKDATKERAALKHYELGKKSLAIGGYDPVAYFPGHGAKPTKGSKKITTLYRGVLYRFTSEANKKTFLANPERFEPMYGGWCAWAMSDGKGSKTEPNPKSFTIEDGRLFLFYDGFFANTRKSWKKNGGAPKLKVKSDTNWKRISGEPARVDPKPAKKKDSKSGDAKKKGGSN